jgi:CO/xanthine dehydrogenase Mo-binding subunit
MPGLAIARMTMKFALGRAAPRTEEPRLLAGRGRYTDDFALPRLAHGYEHPGGAFRHRSGPRGRGTNASRTAVLSGSAASIAADKIVAKAKMAGCRRIHGAPSGP